MVFGCLWLVGDPLGESAKHWCKCTDRACGDCLLTQVHSCDDKWAAIANCSVPLSGPMKPRMLLTTTCFMSGWQHGVIEITFKDTMIIPFQTVGLISTHPHPPTPITHTHTPTPMGGRGFLMFPACLESQGFQFDPTFPYLLFCSSASCYSFCLILS